MSMFSNDKTPKHEGEKKRTEEVCTHREQQVLKEAVLNTLQEEGRVRKALLWMGSELYPKTML